MQRITERYTRIREMPRWRVAALVLVLAALLPAPGVMAQQAAALGPLTALERAALFPTANQIEEGRNVVEAHCAGCHGLDGLASDPELPNLASQRTIYLYRAARRYQQGGGVGAPMHEPLRFLDDTALLQASMYFASLEYPQRPAPEPEPWLTDDDPLRAVRAATAGCASCHGPQGNSRIPGMPSLTAQHPDYFVTAMQAYQAGERSHNMMQMLTKTLSEDVIRDMGLYYALQEPQAAQSSVAGDVAAGRAASAPCASCHGADGNASGADMPSLAGQDAVYLLASMKSYQDGTRDHEAMQGAMADVPPEDVMNMATFYAAQAPLARAVRAPLTTREWLERCARCHGSEGNSPDPRYPSLAGQNAPYFIATMEAYATEVRRNRIMHAMSEPLSTADVERLAAYFEVRTPDQVIYLELPCAEQGAD